MTEFNGYIEPFPPPMALPWMTDDQDILVVHSNIGVGPTGPKGDTGAQGIQGERGERGDVGPRMLLVEQLAIVETTEANQTTIDIPFNSYNHNQDILFVNIDNLDYIEGSDYTIDEENQQIIFDTAIANSGTKIKLRRLYQTIDISTYDISNYVSDIVENYATTSYVDQKAGEVAVGVIAQAIDDYDATAESRLSITSDEISSEVKSYVQDNYYSKSSIDENYYNKSQVTQQATQIAMAVVDANHSVTSWEIEKNGVITRISSLEDGINEFETIIHDMSAGTLVCKKNKPVGALVNADGSFDVVQITWNGNTPTIGNTLSKFATTKATIGTTSGYKTELSQNGYRIYKNNESIFAQYLNSNGTQFWNSYFFERPGTPSDGFVFDIIERNNVWTRRHNYIGSNNTSQYAEIDQVISDSYSTVEMKSTGHNSISGIKAYTGTSSAHAELQAGNGLDGTPNMNYFRVWPTSTTSTVAITVSSDRRLKEHIDFLSEEDSIDFIDNLKPAVFINQVGMKTLGFYAQDVLESDVWDSNIVQESPIVDEKIDDTPLSLDYQALIAPLVAYCQKLEQRINDLEDRIAILESED